MRRPIAAAELMAELSVDRAYIKMRAEKEAELAAKVARWRVEEASLVADLKRLA